jgi:hypothetical protein
MTYTEIFLSRHGREQENYLRAGNKNVEALAFTILSRQEVDIFFRFDVKTMSSKK